MIYTLKIFLIVLQSILTRLNILQFDIYLVACFITAIYHLDEVILSMILSKLSNGYLFSYRLLKIKIIENKGKL